MLERIREDADVIPFVQYLAPNPTYKLVDFACRAHPQFRYLWDEITRHLGYSREESHSVNIPAFYYNYWMTKPRWMKEYIEHIRKVYEYMENEESIQVALHSDSNYTLPKPRYEMKYLTHHCFLLERLPCLYFWSKKASIKPVYTIR